MVNACGHRFSLKKWIKVCDVDDVILHQTDSFNINTRWIERYFQISEVNITVFVLTFPHNQQINEADGKRECVSH